MKDDILLLYSYRKGHGSKVKGMYEYLGGRVGQKKNMRR